MNIQITDDSENLYIQYENIILTIDKNTFRDFSQKQESLDEYIRNYILFLSKTKTIEELKEIKTI